MHLTITNRRLELKHPWTISRNSSDYKEYNFVTLEADGTVGYGEAAHNVRYGESLTSIRAFLEMAKPLFEATDPWQFHTLGRRILALAPGQHAAKAALDLALIDWVTRKLGLPLYRYLGLDKSKTPITSYSIGIDQPEIMQQKIREAADFPILKIKLGTDNDETIMRAVRDVTDRVVRVDANEGWKDRWLALEKIQWLAEMAVEFVEQPIPAGRLDDVVWLRERSPLPIIADEDVKMADDIPALASAYDGINLKIMKSGGLQEALRMISLARCLNLKIMLGCMVESSVGITAAAHLSPLVDWADLDGSMLIKDDPFVGAEFAGGRIILPDAPGIGATPRSA